MRPLILLGIALIAIGTFALYRGFSYSQNRTVVEIGELKATVRESRELPKWAGVVAVGAGLALVLAGSRRRG